MQWQPMDTAPDDNRSVLLKRRGTYSPVVAWKHRQLGYVAFELPDDKFIIISDATGWMEIPNNDPTFQNKIAAQSFLKSQEQTRIDEMMDSHG